MKSLIIGHRGFVGSNLARQLPQATGVGRREIGALAGQCFDDIYCAAPQAKKWWANQNPEQDRQEVENLIEACRDLACTGFFVLFSTVDVYDPPSAVDENSPPSKDSHPYGRHRSMLEQTVIDTFGNQSRIIRLPALVGHGLKKNIIYDLLNNNNLDQINPNSAFQWFNLDHLAAVLDQAKLLSHGRILNVVSEPVATSTILSTWFADINERLNWQLPKTGYNVKTIHGPQGSQYLYSADDALKLHLKPFIEAQRSHL
ncbi:NAD(P)-dependent oxidoreductase [Synechococcus sp. RSCCF101]|uniref:NAD-dependent epimerase/dehydratase family protein n=1 Tax=Synechococcus sp. RSCCF101 TaxID=2511069 RepID=UPI0012449E6C|nr:NAD(P)-dependent oxidoreductase [Synechococcus sp. RSCCF101]QEY32365.1 NAD(P)-dependent oxidoreductase [Synechococcus sp. RSCCF101]